MFLGCLVMVAASLTIALIAVVMIALALWVMHTEPSSDAIGVLVAMALVGAFATAIHTAHEVYTAPNQIQFVPVLTPVLMPAGKAEAC